MTDAFAEAQEARKEVPRRSRAGPFLWKLEGRTENWAEEGRLSHWSRPSGLRRGIPPARPEADVRRALCTDLGRSWSFGRISVILNCQVERLAKL